jgi:pathogenesis-related protein 1
VVVGAAGAPPLHAATALDVAQRQEMLSAHNQWRREVGVPDLRWADDLADTAQRWAEFLRASRNCAPAHNEGAIMGENLYWASATPWSDGRVEKQKITPTRVVDSWAGEKPLYDQGSGACRPGAECGHYTQLVWRRTTELGCGMAVCGDLSQIWVCNYRPPGNYAGQRPY